METSEFKMFSKYILKPIKTSELRTVTPIMDDLSIFLSQEKKIRENLKFSSIIVDDLSTKQVSRFSLTIVDVLGIFPSQWKQVNSKFSRVMVYVLSIFFSQWKQVNSKFSPTMVDDLSIFFSQWKQANSKWWMIYKYISKEIKTSKFKILSNHGGWFVYIYVYQSKQMEKFKCLPNYFFSPLR